MHHINGGLGLVFIIILFIVVVAIASNGKSDL
jgi:hypothetical protein